MRSSDPARPPNDAWGGPCLSAPSRSLEDTVIVVTGAGGGIGGAAARLALEAEREGGRRRPPRTPWPRSSPSGAPSASRWSSATSREEATGDALVGAGVDAFGRVDSVVANAGIGFYGGVLDVTPEQVRS